VPVAILHPFRGTPGDMTLGALVGVPLDPGWLRALPAKLALDGATVDVRDAKRTGIECTKVDFSLPLQAHGRHPNHIREIVTRAALVALAQVVRRRIYSGVPQSRRNACRKPRV